jgi:multimeric flavodoxin WrbA
MIPATIQKFLDTQVKRASADYSGLKAVFLNGTLKPSPEVSQTEALMEISTGIMRGLGVDVTVLRTVDHVIPPGLQTNMTEHGYERDDFPAIYDASIAPADIIVLATPIWLGDQSTQTRLIIERMYARSGDLNENGQWSYYGKVGGALVTGNEDGGKHCSAMMLYSLQHIGLLIPPQSDSYWNGEAGPGPSYLDPDEGGQKNAWTTRNTAFMTWNILHLAKMLQGADGIPPYGNLAADWDLSQPDHPNPEYR